jgi:hypothetical protein
VKGNKMVDPLSVTTVAKSLAGVAETVKEGVGIAAVGASMKESLERGDIAPLAMVAFGGLVASGGVAFSPVADMPIKTEFAGIFKGIERAGEDLDKILHELGIDAVTYKSGASLKSVLEGTGLDRPVSFLVTSFDSLKQFEQGCLSWADSKGYLITARKVEYVSGRTEYQSGLIGEKAPLIGSLAEVMNKWELTEHITGGELIWAGADLCFIVTIVITAGGYAPFLVTRTTARILGISGGPRAAGPIMRDPTIAYSATAKTTIQEAGSQLLKEGVQTAERSAVEELSRVWASGETVTLSNGRITVGDIADRFRVIRPYITDYAQEKYKLDPFFRAKCDRLADQLREASSKGPGEVQRVITQIKREGSGELGRQLTLDGMRPYFRTSSIEVPVPVNGRTTRIDILFEDAKLPVVGNRGFFVPENGKLAVEVKTGSGAYIGGQLEHLLFQTQGTKVADAGITAVTKDISSLEAAVEAKIRDALRPTSPVFKFLPEKAVLDEAMIGFLEKMAKEGMVK